MRIVASGVPSSAYKYLLPHERAVVVVRFHPARFIPPAVTAMGALLLTSALSPVMRGNAALGAWLITLLLIANLVRTVLDWLSRYFMVTSTRIFLCDGSGITFELPLLGVKGVRLTRPLAGRLLGYGTLVFDSAHLAIDSLPYPEQLYLEIRGMLYRDVNADPED